MIGVFALIAWAIAFLPELGKRSMLRGFTTAETSTVEANWQIRLHTGVPGAEGEENIATENTKKTFTLISSAAGTRNKAAIEWVEVKAKEKYTYFTLWEAGVGTFRGYAKIANSKGEEVGVEVEVGDTFRINETTGLTITVE